MTSMAASASVWSRAMTLTASNIHGRSIAIADCASGARSTAAGNTIATRRSARPCHSPWISRAAATAASARRDSAGPAKTRNGATLVGVAAAAPAIGIASHNRIAAALQPATTAGSVRDVCPASSGGTDRRTLRTLHRGATTGYACNDSEAAGDLARLERELIEMCEPPD